MTDERILRALEGNQRAFDDLRTFLRELTLRHERAFEAMIRRLDAQGAVIDAQTAAIKDQSSEFVQESRAQRQALFRMLDRLDGGASGTA